MHNYPDIGVQSAEILLPRTGTDLQKWAVIACDQFTSEPEYWQEVARIVGRAPSTYNLILPEVHLGTGEEANRISSTQQAMREYLETGILTHHDGFVLVERQTGGKTRRGLLLALDLECYDYNKGSQTLIRATEGTILDRLPPRIRIRKDAPLELPHILVLIDDPQHTVIEPLVERKDSLPLLYDTDLMLGSGHVRGYAVNDPAAEAGVIAGLRALAEPGAFRARYGVVEEKGVLLFAMGDGNHSLATARAIWETLKPHVGMQHPARYALVEIENVHDAGLDFEPIHRVLFGVYANPQSAMQAFFDGQVSFQPMDPFQEMVARVKAAKGPDQTVGMVDSQGCAVASIHRPVSNLPVGSLQAFLDDWLKQGGAEKIDYVHGDEVVDRVGTQPGNLGFYLPAMQKTDLFKTVILDGALPRKTFSMGEARDKRFYLEARRIA